MDAAGRLFIRGRKKEMIVTPEGLNVFPEDVERVVNAMPGVKDSAAVGVTQNGEERVHVALIVEPGIDADGRGASRERAAGRSPAHSRRRACGRAPNCRAPKGRRN